MLVAPAEKAVFATLLDPSVSAQAPFKNILESLGHQRIVTHVDVLSSTLLIYDVLLNLHVEMEHIWMRKWNFLTVLYVFQRYIPFFDTAVLVLHHQFGANLSPRYCVLNYEIAGWSFIIGVMLSEIILLLRVWAIWKRGIPVAVGLAIFFLACWVPCSILLREFLDAMKFEILPLPNFRGCFIASGSHVLFVMWVLVMVYDAGTLMLILIPGVQAYRKEGRSEFVEAVYRDGVIYYALIFFASINVVVVLILSDDFAHLLTSWVNLVFATGVIYLPSSPRFFCRRDLVIKQDQYVDLLWEK
ncbi:hypothetical protein L218DRAFT_1008997 [Marasmius fiardii PR-910]|nr:hypothetical protein L218DRAFT_1008997 [Marasmius fiardii PR-910]